MPPNSTKLSPKQLFLADECKAYLLEHYPWHWTRLPNMRTARPFGHSCGVVR